MGVALLAAVLLMTSSAAANDITMYKNSTANSTTEVDDMKNKTDIICLTITESGMAAEESEYEILKTDDGVRISHYVGRWSFDETIDREECVVERVTGGTDLYDKAAALLAECDIKAWNGFSGYDPMVLDGVRFVMQAKLADGTTVNANGSNAFPDGYHTLKDGIYDLLNEQ